MWHCSANAEPAPWGRELPGRSVRRKSRWQSARSPKPAKSAMHYSVPLLRLLLLVAQVAAAAASHRLLLLLLMSHLVQACEMAAW